MPSFQFVDLMNDILEVVGVKVLAVDENHVFDAAGHDQLILMKQSKITGIEPAVRVDYPAVDIVREVIPFGDIVCP